MIITELSSPYIDTWKDWEPCVRLFKKNAARQWVPETGLLNVTFSLSLTEQGAAIGTLTGIVTTEAAGEDTLGGFYVGVVDLSTLASQLPDNATYPDGTKIYLQVVKAGDIQVEAIQKTLRRMRY